MKKLIVGIFLILMFVPYLAKAEGWVLHSPDGALSINILNTKEGQGGDSRLLYTVSFDKKQILQQSPLGIDRSDEQFSKNLTLVSESKSATIDERYTLKSGKRLECHNYANEKTLTFRNKNGQQVQLILRAYNDGVAFRYRFPETDNKNFKVTEEFSGFKFSTNGKAWIHPYDWNSRFKPSYEQYCQSNIVIESLSDNVRILLIEVPMDF